VVSLQPISATSAYPLLLSQVDSICDLQRLALYWFHAPGLQLDKEVSQSTYQPPSCRHVFSVGGQSESGRDGDSHEADVPAAVEHIEFTLL